MSFPLGKPILALAVITLITGAALLVRNDPPKKDLTLWVFADLHAATYRSIVPEFERLTGKSVDVKLINSRAMPVRLESMFMADVSGPNLPDLVALEISWVGRFFRPPVADIALEPLNDMLAKSGWKDRVLPERFSPWTKQGTIFGVPHDVHPVTISYRKDLFDEAGVDLAGAKTWADFHEKCIQFKEYWSARGYPHRHAIELPRSSSEYVNTMLLQRGVNLVDDFDNIYFTDPRVAQTLAFYAQLVAGPRAVASEAAGGTGVWTSDVLAGNLCAFITPDWRIYQIKTYAPQLAGKLHMIPLPRFDPTDSPTSTWGGTMMGIPRLSQHHDDAWRLLEFLYFSPAGLKARQRFSNILPPLIEQWSDPGYHRADPFFAGQKVDELYIELARQIPRRYVTPASNLASVQLSVLLNRAVAHVNRHGAAGLEDQCRQWTQEAADDLKRRIEHGKLQ